MIADDVRRETADEIITASTPLAAASTKDLPWRMPNPACFRAVSYHTLLGSSSKLWWRMVSIHAPVRVRP